MKIISVNYDLPPEVVPWMPGRDYSRYNIMPTDHRTTDRIWPLTEDWKCLLQLDVGWMEFHARMGWWLDWESIPGALESLEKRDDRPGLIAGTLHDMMFALQYPYFDTANTIFREVMRLEGTGFARRWYKYAAVQSCAGMSAWEDSSNPSKVDIEKKWVSIKTVPVVSDDFMHLIPRSIL